MKTTLNRFLALLLLFVFLTACADRSVADNTAPDTESIRGGITAYNESLCGAADEREWVRKGLTESAGSGSEWYIMALERLQCEADFSGYADALRQYLRGTSIAGATTRQKFALTLIACGCGNDEFVRSALEDSIGQQGIMSWIFGLHLLNNGLTSGQYTKEQVISRLLETRTTDGGWAVTGAYGDVDVTAMAIQALSPEYSSNPEVREAVDHALSLLSGKQLDNGGFQSYGNENPESVAQVIIALCALGIDPLSDERFRKNGFTVLDALAAFRLPDGSFCHLQGEGSSATATVQVYCAMTAVRLLREGRGSFYRFDTPPRNTPVRSGSSLLTGYKRVVCAAALVLSLIACAVLFFLGKRKAKNYLFILLLLLIVCAVTVTTDIQSAGNYYSGQTAPKTDPVGRVTMTIRCDTIVGKSDSESIPADGVILPVTSFEIVRDESVFDLLTEAARVYGIHMENQGSGAHGMVYIVGINYLYEFDFGDLSGWVYHVNGEAPSVGCGEYTLSDGDSVEWLYTCDLGNDVM